MPSFCRIHPLTRRFGHAPHPPQPAGGRPFRSDRDCFAGIVYRLRNGIRWMDMPAEFPSGPTCWRRHNAWVKAGVFPAVRAIILAELQAAGQLDTSELVLDATFAEDRKGGPSTARQNAASASRSRSLSTAAARH
ncbi:MAG: transposase [Gemmataceae bacterium]